MLSGVVAVDGAYGEGLLPDAGQVAEQVFSLLALFVGVQTHVVDAGKSQHGQLVAGRQFALDLDLRIDVVGQERKSQHLEQQLQVRLAYGKEVGRPLREGAVAAKRHFRCAERRLEGVFFGVAVAQAEIQHRTERSGPVGGEGAGVETDLAHQIGVDDAHGAARSALRGEVVDVGNLDAVHVEDVLRRAAAAYDQVVAVTDGRERYAGIGAHDARNVAVGARALFDLAQADHLQPDGALGRAAERRGGDGHGVELRGVLHKLDLDEGRGGRDDVFGRERVAIADAGGRQPVDARADAFDGEASRRVGRGALVALSVEYDGRIGDGAAREPVDDTAAQRVALGGESRQAASYR